MKTFHVFSGVLFVSFFSCHRANNSDSKSALGLEAANKYQDQIKSASTFVELGKWFKDFEISNSNNGSSNSSTISSSIPSDLKPGLIAYVNQQLQRIAAFETALRIQNTSQREQRIRELLAVEAEELKDIALTIIDPNHRLSTQDLFAKFIKEGRRSNYIDRYAEKYLGNIFKNRFAKNIVDNIDTEKNNYYNFTIETYLKSATGLNDLAKDLANTKQALNDFNNVLNGQPVQTASKIKGAPAAFMNYYSNYIGAPGNSVNSAPDLALLNDVPDGGAVTPGSSPVPGSVTPPSSSTCVYPYSVPFTCPNGPSICVAPGTSPTNAMLGCSAILLGNLLNKNWFQADNSSFQLGNDSQSQAKLLPSPAGKPCHERGLKSAKALVICERHAYNTIDLSRSRGKYLAPATKSSGFQLSGKGRKDLITKAYTPVQDQGQEGSCTAYGLTHTVQANLNIIGQTHDKIFDAQSFWNTYSDPQMQSALDAARNFAFGSAKVSNSTQLKSIDEMRSVLDQGRAVYMGSDTADSWSNASGEGKASEVECGSGSGGHAYSIQGYTYDTNGDLLFVIKNSWGDNWGEQGYGYISSKCYDGSLGNGSGMVEAFDLQVN